jgi:hypothetical protein
MRTLLIISVLSLSLVGCGGSSSSTRQSTDIGPEAGAGGEDVVAPSGGTETGGASGETGGTGGTGAYDPTGGTGNDVATGGQDVGTGGQDVGTGGAGTGGEPEATGGSGTGGDAAGGTGNVGGGCEPWDCTNIAIQLAGWDSASGDPVPEACGLVQDPCTGQYIDCGGCGEFQECGGETIVGLDSDYNTIYAEGVDNICGGNCLETDPSRIICGEIGLGDPRTMFICNYQGTTSPEPGCQENLEPGLGLQYWCCE